MFGEGERDGVGGGMKGEDLIVYGVITPYSTPTIIQYLIRR